MNRNRESVVIPQYETLPATGDLGAVLAPTYPRVPTNPAPVVNGQHWRVGADDASAVEAVGRNVVELNSGDDFIAWPIPTDASCLRVRISIRDKNPTASATILYCLHNGLSDRFIQITYQDSSVSAYFKDSNGDTNSTSSVIITPNEWNTVELKIDSDILTLSCAGNSASVSAPSSLARAYSEAGTYFFEASALPFDICDFTQSCTNTLIDNIPCDESTGTTLANTQTTSRPATLSDGMAHALAWVPTATTYGVWVWEDINRVATHREINSDSIGGGTDRWVTSFRIPENTTRIRFLFENRSTTTDITKPFIVSLTNAWNLGISSVGTTLTENLTTGWASLKTNGVNGINIPHGETATKQWSDWIDISPIPALDSGLPIIQVSLNGDLSDIGYNGSSDGLGSLYYHTAEGGSLYVAGSAFDSITIVLGLDFNPSEERINIDAFGDSITYGWNNSGANAKWFGLVAHTGVQSLNNAVSGENTTQILSRLKNLGRIPSVAIYSAYSPNDGYGSLDQTQANLMIANFEEAFLYCKQNKIMLIPTEIAPNDNYNLASDQIRKSLMYYFRNRCGVLYRMITAINTGASPDRYNALYNDDGVHMNDAGAVQCKAVYEAYITALLSSGGKWSPA